MTVLGWIGLGIGVWVAANVVAWVSALIGSARASRAERMLR